MAIQTFTSGQTLTAAQMTSLQANDYNWTVSAKTTSYVLVAADKGTTITMSNAGATTITVNTGLFTAGDTVRIINLGAGACTITAGTATVSSAGSLALVQNQAGTLWFSSASAAIFIPDDKTVGAGLTLISATTIGSAVANVTVSNAFSSTYDNYRIIVNSGVGSADSHLRMTLGATATGYYFAGVSANYAGGSAGVGAAQNAAFWEAGYNTTNSLFLAIDVLSPNLAKNTMFSTVRCNATTGGATVATGGYLADTTQYTAFTLTPASGTLTGGTIRVYGYQNS